MTRAGPDDSPHDILRIVRFVRRRPGMAPEKGWKQARKKFELAICEHCDLDLNNHGIGFASKRVAMRDRLALQYAVQ